MINHAKKTNPIYFRQFSGYLERKSKGLGISRCKGRVFIRVYAWMF